MAASESEVLRTSPLVLIGTRRQVLYLRALNAQMLGRHGFRIGGVAYESGIDRN